MFLAMSGMFAMFFFNTLYIQRVLGYGPLKAGLAFLPFTAGIMVSAGLASKFAPRIGVRPVAAVGMVLDRRRAAAPDAAAGPRLVPARRAAALILASLGMGAVFMPLTLIATTGLEDEDQGLASGLFNTSQQIGGALGLAILSTIAASHTNEQLDGAARARLPLGVRRRGGASCSRPRRARALLRKRDVARIEQQAETETRRSPPA